MARIWLAALFSSSSRRPDATSSSSAQRKKSSEPKRFLKECHGGIERTLSLLDGKRDLFGETWPDMVVGAHTEGVEAQRLLALASHGNHD
jgi:hypothetical protein